MAGSPPERDGLARGLRHRPDRDGAPASLTSATSATSTDRSRASIQLLLGAAGLLALSLARGAAIQLGATDLAPAALFAAAVLAATLAMPAVRRSLAGLPSARNLALGAGMGMGLLLPGAWMRAHGLVGPGAVLSPGYALAWIPLMALISSAEELALRGWLQPLARRTWGPAPAVVAVAALFAAIHAPIYGWVALPLDLGVGILIGCLREYTGSVAACAIAHFIADIGHWWLP